MYNFSDYVRCTKEEILRRISQEEIYLLVLDSLPPVNHYVRSPFRDDPNAGAYYMWYNGILYFKDFGDPKRPMRDCFQAVMDLMQIPFRECLLKINDHFKLGLNGSNTMPIIYQDVIIDKKVNKSMPGRIHKINEEKSFNEIIHKPRGFFPIDKNFWFNRYEIKRNQLIEDNTTALVWYQFYSKKGELITIRPADIAYAYNDFLEGKTKIYRPLNTEKRGKWLTNCNENDVGGINRLPKTGDLLIITKSYKDYRVLKNLGYNVIWFQNEGMFPNEIILRNLCARFKKILIIYDNDSKGIIAGNLLVSRINDLVPRKSKLAFIPSIYKDVKDPSDLKHRYGGIELQTFLKHIL